MSKRFILRQSTFLNAPALHVSLYLILLSSCTANSNRNSKTAQEHLSIEGKVAQENKSNSVKKTADVYYPIGPIQQPKTNDCWITSLTMLKRYKTPDLSIDEMVDVLGEPYRGFYSNNKGLAGSYLSSFYDKAGVAYDAPQNYTIDGWIDLLKRKGPAIVDLFSFIDPVKNIVWTHAVLLVGIEKKGDDLSTNFIYIDPAKGEEVSDTFRNFLRRYEAEPKNQVNHIQVAYLK